MSELAVTRRAAGIAAAAPKEITNIRAANDLIADGFHNALSRLHNMGIILSGVPTVQSHEELVRAAAPSNDFGPTQPSRKPVVQGLTLNA